MYGFKPRHAQGKPVQNLAGGGIVHSLTGMLGMRDKTPEEMRAADAKAQARNKEAAARVAERNKPAEQPAAPAAKAISEYSGMSAMQRREKEQGLKDGGMVKPRGFKAGGMIHGPGTGTSDSIETEKLPGTFIMPADSTQAIGPAALGKMGEKMPVRLSNGEFEIPPEQVQALGEAVLTVMRNATHQPTSGQEAPTGKGFTPHQFFAGGGTVQDKERLKRVNQIPVGSDVQAPAPTGQDSTDLSRNVNNGLNALGGMGAVASVPLRASQAVKAAAAGSGATALPSGIPRLAGPAQAAAAPAADFVAGMGPNATTMANNIPRIGNAPTQALPAVNAALQEGAQANALSAAARTASGAGAGANAAAANQPVDAPAAAPAPSTPGGAVFGFYPQLAGGQRTTYATDAKLRTGVQATGPSTFAPATPSERTIIGGGNGQPAPPESAASQVQNKAPTRTAAPFATTAPTSAGFMPGTRAVFNESGKAIGDLANQGRYAAAAGETARAALAYVPAVVDDVVGGAVRAVGPALADAGKQFLGMNEATAPAPAPVPAAAQPPRPAAPTGTTQANAAPTGQVAIQPMNDGAQPVAPPPSTAAAPQPQAEQVAPGAYRYGRGQYGDSPTGQQGVVSGPAGQPSAQNMAAAEALASRQSAAGFMPGGVQAPTVRNTSNDWAARNNLRNLEVSASSITNQPSFGRGGRGYVPPAAAAYQAALQTDAALQQAQPGADIAAMRENAGIQREGMQQTGANTRTGMQEQGSNARDAGRTALARDDFGLRKEAAGFQTRAAARLEGLQTRYEAEADPAKQAVLARQIRELQGKEQPARYKVAAGGQQIDANGVAYRVPDRVFNEQTGKFSDGTGAAPAPQAPPKSGEVRNGFRFKGGNPNDQANWAKV